MSKAAFELVESVGAFDEGEILDVTARFGDWHHADVKPEPLDDDGGSVELTFHELENSSRARPRPAV